MKTDGNNSPERDRNPFKTGVTGRTGQKPPPTVKRVDESGIPTSLPDYRGIGLRTDQELTTFNTVSQTKGELSVHHLSLFLPKNGDNSAHPDLLSPKERG